MSNGKFVVIDGNELSFEDGETLLQVAARADIEIPTLCYDPRLTPAGACCCIQATSLAVVPALTTMRYQSSRMR